MIHPNVYKTMTSLLHKGDPEKRIGKTILLGDCGAQIITLQNVVVRHSWSQQVEEQSENSWENIYKFNEEGDSWRLTHKNVLL